MHVKCYIVYSQARFRYLLQGELLAAVNDTLEALGLPRGSSPPPLSRGQRWLAAHGLSAGLPTDTASSNEPQQHSASPATSSAHHSASSVSGQLSGSMVSALTLPHMSDQEAVSVNPGRSAGTESGLHAQRRNPDGAAQEQLDTLFAAAKPHSIIGAESIEARSADGIQLQMLQSSTSIDVHLETMLRGVQADASGSAASSSAYQQGAMPASRAASGLAASNLDASAIQLISMADSARSERLNPEPDLARTEPEPDGAESQLLGPAPQSFAPVPRSLSPAPLSFSTESQTLSSAPQSLSPVPQLLSPAPLLLSTESQTLSSAPQSLSPVPQFLSPAPLLFSTESQSLSSEPVLPSKEPDDHPWPAMPAAGTQPGLDAAATQLTVGTSIAQQQDDQTEAMGLHSCMRPTTAQLDTGPEAADTGQVASSSPDSISGAGSSSSRAGSIGSSVSLSQARHLLAVQSSVAQFQATGVAQAALLVDSRITVRTGSSAFGTSKAVGSTSRNTGDSAQTQVVSSAELQLHPDRATDLDNSIGSMVAFDSAQRQSEGVDAQDVTQALDAMESDHASLVGGGSVGTGDREVTVLQAKEDLSSAMPQRFHAGARLVLAGKMYVLTMCCCICACK